MSEFDAARRIWEEAISLGILIESAETGGLEITSPLDAEIDLPRAFVLDLRDHKDEVVGLLQYMEQADRLLIEASRELGRRWHPGIDLDCEEFLVAEQALNKAYWSLDLIVLSAAIKDRSHVFDTIIDKYT